MNPEPPKLLQNSTLPPAQPNYILRGHTAQIHSVHFLRQNLRLLTGDADGWAVLWNLPVKRPVAVWKPHGGSVLGVGAWGENEENIITHGRDNKLHVWQIRSQDEPSFSKTLPIDDTTTERKQPWLLHSLDVNALNFCSFAMCPVPSTLNNIDQNQNHSILLAVPGVQDGLVNITSLPTNTRIATLPPPQSLSTGMLMAVSIQYTSATSDSTNTPNLLVAAGYESGHTALWRQHPATRTWTTTYIHATHAQPVLSVAFAPDLRTFYSSSADAILAQHPVPNPESTSNAAEPQTTLQTKHAGQQALTVRSDGRILATAGWDGRVRVYDARKLREVAVLKWHKVGCYAACFAVLLDGEGGEGSVSQGSVSQRREARAQKTHLLAAGSKDGKVSLWEVY